MTTTTPINPWYTGQTSPVLDILLNNDGGPENITGLIASNFALSIQSVLGVDQTGAGTFSIVATNPAEIHYAVNAADVTTKGTYNAFVKATFPDGVRIYDPIIWTIIAS